MISVVIPAFNAAAYLAEAVESVWGQEWPELEILIVDDGSTDATAEIAAALGQGIRLLQQANGGAATARNAGVLAARGAEIAFLDADDVWPPDHLRLLASRLAGRPEALMALGRTQLVGQSAAAGRDAPLQHFGAPWHAPVFGAGLFRREVFTVVGAMDPTLQPAEDLDWFIRAREAMVDTVVVDDTTLWYRWHGASLTSGADPIRRRMLLALKRSLDRRRAGHQGDVRPLAGREWLPTRRVEGAG